MDRNYYVEYYELEREHWWFRARMEIIRSQVAAIANGRTDLRILNIGVATGATSVMLEAFGKVKSVEYDATCYQFVKDRLHIDIEQGSILELQFADESYDLVCAFDVIEHVEDDAKAVSEMKRVCGKGGSVLVTVPAFMMLWSRHDEVNHHFRRYRLAQLDRLFSGSGTIRFNSYFNSFLFPPVFVVRMLGKAFPFLFKRDGAGSDFSLMRNAMLDRILYRIMRSENMFLKNRIGLWAGVSAILSWRKS